ncbi:MAG: FeoA family protein [Elusimicrobia bacterium]|nr:FeoA family protein [Elusimicrobiota bacterium]
MNTEKIFLTDLDAGLSGTVKEIAGGFGAIRRLRALGFGVGDHITKLSGMHMRGPVIIKVRGTHIAIGYGIASKIIVEVKK